MADLSDVSNALVGLLASAVYPTGTANPSAISAAYGQPPVTVNCPAKVYAGWPQPAQLDADMAANVVNISIYPRPEDEALPVLGPEDVVTVLPVTTISAVVSNLQVTLGGTVSAPQNVGVFVNRIPFIYAVQAGDTLTTIATALATLIAVQFPGTTSSGGVITVSGAYAVSARVGAFGMAAQFIARTSKRFQISIWANRFDVRDSVAKLIEPLLRSLHRISLSDGSVSQLVYISQTQDDFLQKQVIYRRNLIFALDWATTLTSQIPQIIAEEVTLSPDSAPSTTVYVE